MPDVLQDSRFVDNPKSIPPAGIRFYAGYPDRSFNQDSTVDSNLNFLQKPFLSGALTRKIRNVLDTKTRCAISN